jgi:S-adenosylmethionine decarboxylase
MKEILLELLITLLIMNANGAKRSPEIEDLAGSALATSLPPRSGSVPIYDVEGISIQHLAADFYFCTVPCGSEVLEEILRQAAAAAGATALTFSHHKFEPDGVSAVLILGESHISVHYWYEKHFALIDIVTCGSCNPYAAIDLLKLKFGASTIAIHDLIRPFK